MVVQQVHVLDRALILNLADLKKAGCEIVWAMREEFCGTLYTIRLSMKGMA